MGIFFYSISSIAFQRRNFGQTWQNIDQMNIWLRKGTNSCDSWKGKFSLLTIVHLPEIRQVIRSDKKQNGILGCPFLFPLGCPVDEDPWQKKFLHNWRWRRDSRESDTLPFQCVFHYITSSFFILSDWGLPIRFYLISLKFFLADKSLEKLATFIVMRWSVLFDISLICDFDFSPFFPLRRSRREKIYIKGRRRKKEGERRRRRRRKIKYFSSCAKEICPGIFYLHKSKA